MSTRTTRQHQDRASLDGLAFVAVLVAILAGTLLLGAATIASDPTPALAAAPAASASHQQSSRL